MNPSNPYKTPEFSSDTNNTSVSRDWLRSIGRSQRHVNLAFLLYLAVIPIAYGINSMGTGSTLAPMLLGIYILGVIIFGAVAIYRLTAILKGHIVAVIYMLGLLIPLLGLLLLLSINGRATKELRKAGIKVGLMGANVESI
ncbi:MAG: hypothetical protein WCP45_05395 [Verrucomicrobiota bacterium]